MNPFTPILNNLAALAEASDALHAVIIIGSQAREDRPADAYSDLDVMVVVDEPEFFISSDGWLESLGAHHISFIEGTLGGLRERRVLFEGALDVDFIFLPKHTLKDAFEDEIAREILSRGHRVLVDKIGLEPFLPQHGAAVRAYAMPSNQEFQNLTHDFWYHAVWTAKKVLRGEIWTAKFCLDTYMKSMLLKMIECHAHAMKGPAYDTWHNGRFIEEWAEKWVIEALHSCFAHYDKAEIKPALLATLDLFRTLAVAVAERCCYDYPVSADTYAADWVTESL